MKPKRLQELKELVASPLFREWWNQVLGARLALADTQARYDELLAQATLMEFRSELTQKNAIDTLYQAGEREDASATLLFEATDLENRSFRQVSDFEEQRIKASDLWYRLGAAERVLEEAKAKNLTGPELKTAERNHQAAAHEYERESTRKQRLWEEVERLWTRSTEVGLLVSEERHQGKKVRRDAEGLFALAEERKTRAKELKVEAEGLAKAVDTAKAQLATTFGKARENFGCSVGTDFIYFRAKDDSSSAFAVAMTDDRDSYNIEVQALVIYSVDKQKGVSFLEPARPPRGTTDEGDRRIEDYFLKGRKGSAPKSPA